MMLLIFFPIKEFLNIYRKKEFCANIFVAYKNVPKEKTLLYDEKKIPNPK